MNSKIIYGHCIFSAFFLARLGIFGTVEKHYDDDEFKSYLNVNGENLFFFTKTSVWIDSHPYHNHKDQIITPCYKKNSYNIRPVKLYHNGEEVWVDTVL